MEQHKTLYPEIKPDNVVIPKDQTLGDWLKTRIARYDTRSPDWDALKFQADFDPKYRRAQLRYIGTGGTGIDTDDNAVPAEHFTFSTMILPAGCEGPLHLHTDAEEVFFILRGSKLRFIIEHKGERFETILKERDLFSVPPGVYRGLVNEGIEEALMCVIIGNSKPVTPTYPPDHPVAKIKRPKPARCRLKVAAESGTLALLPLPLAGEGWGGGSQVGAPAMLPSPYPSPQAGRGAHRWR